MVNIDEVERWKFDYYKEMIDFTDNKEEVILSIPLQTIVEYWWNNSKETFNTNKVMNDI